MNERLEVRFKVRSGVGVKYRLPDNKRTRVITAADNGWRLACTPPGVASAAYESREGGIFFAHIPAPDSDGSVLYVEHSVDNVQPRIVARLRVARCTSDAATSVDVGAAISGGLSCIAGHPGSTEGGPGTVARRSDRSAELLWDAAPVAHALGACGSPEKLCIAGRRLLRKPSCRGFWLEANARPACAGAREWVSTASVLCAVQHRLESGEVEGADADSLRALARVVEERGFPALRAFLDGMRVWPLCKICTR